MTEGILIPHSETLHRLSDHWFLCRDGDPDCYAMARRHYSARNYREQRQRLFVGPGRKLVLLTGEGDALFVWRKFFDKCEPRQIGINCALFHNEGVAVRSSELIREAVAVVWKRWGIERCYTLVDPERIRSINPGCCFIKAGWKRCGVSKTGKIILEFL